MQIRCLSYQPYYASIATQKEGAKWNRLQFRIALSITKRIRDASHEDGVTSFERFYL